MSKSKRNIIIIVFFIIFSALFFVIVDYLDSDTDRKKFIEYRILVQVLEIKI